MTLETAGKMRDSVCLAYKQGHLREWIMDFTSRWPFSLEVLLSFSDAWMTHIFLNKEIVDVTLK